MDDQINSQTSTSPETQQSLSKKERRELRREEQRAETKSTLSAKSLKRLILWAVAILAVGGTVAGVWYLAASQPDTQTQPDGELTQKVSSADWIRGTSSSKVTLVEYADFQCPACAQYYPLVKTLEEEFGNKVAFVFRHFPLSKIHPNAMPAAKAAEAAGAQGKFFEMRDMLFERQTEWAQKPSPKGTFVSYAEELGLNIDQFETDIEKDDLADKIDAQYKAGVASGVNATPTFFLNGVKLVNPRSLDEFHQLIANAISAIATSTPAEHTQ